MPRLTRHERQFEEVLSENSAEAGLSRRGFILGAGAAATGAILLGRHFLPDESRGESEGFPGRGPGNDLLTGDVDFNNADDLERHVTALRTSAERLGGYTVPELADYILQSPNILFDDEYPRIKESMVWTSVAGAFPLVNPEGDITDGLENVSAHVPVQKPLLVLLSLVADAGIECRITSLATSSEHGPGSHHYQGRGVDLGVHEEPIVLMRLINLLHTNAIVEIDEAFAPENPGGFGLNEGELSDATEGDHIHISTAQVSNWSELIASDQDAELFADTTTEQLAAQLGITPSTYFTFSRDQSERLAELGGFEAEAATELLPELFPAGVLEYDERLKFAADEAGIPINMLAAIVTIESAGIADAESNKGAQGIAQMVPSWHGDRIDEISGKTFSSDAERGRYLREYPSVALRAAADYLNELLERTRDTYPDLHTHDPEIYMRAAAAYNGGPDLIPKAMESWRGESWRYARYIQAFYIDSCLASELRSSGYSAHERATKLSSESLRYRLMALSMEIGEDEPTNQQLLSSYSALGSTQPGCAANGEITNVSARTQYHLAKAGYDYVQHPATEVTPGLPPAVQFWFAHGGYVQAQKLPTNVEWQNERAIER